MLLRNFTIPVVLFTFFLQIFLGLNDTRGQDKLADQPPVMTPRRTDVKPFQYVEAKIPLYLPDQKRKSQDLPRMQLPLEPEESLKHLVIPAQFEIQLFAQEPKIHRPICMNWDERGRLWIAESVDYPNELQPEGMGRDRIVICEDTDNDGQADKFTVFADKLSIPTSFTFYKGGLIVHQAPHTLFLKDTNGDDVADERKVLFTGWSTGDTHAGPSNLHWGFDNWVWGIVGYAGFQGEIGGEKHNFRTGFYRFKPDGTKFEFLRNTNNNSWGVGFSEEGLVFGSTANGNPSVYLPIPNRYYESVRGWSSTVLGGIAGSPEFFPITDKVRQVDHHGHFTSAAGHALYTARTYPREYWNRAAFVTEPTGHLVATFLLQKKGTDFTSRNAWNLLASDDEWTAPTMAEVGPDGCVWVIDWYNYIVQHNPTPAGFKTGKGNAYETELRDKKHGRIYRLVPKEMKLLPPLTLKDATAKKLIETLKHDNLFWRKHAQRLLVERGQKDVVADLITLVNDSAVDLVGLNAGAIHALWTLQGLGLLDGSNRQALAAAEKALSHPSAGVRRNAVMVLPVSREEIAAQLSGITLKDDDAHVRLAALLALAEVPTNARDASAVWKMLQEESNLNDRWIPDAATSAAARHDYEFLLAAAWEKKPLPSRLLEIFAIVGEHFARGGKLEEAAGLSPQFAQAEPKITETFLASLAKGWPRNQKVKISPQQEAGLEKLFPQLNSVAKGHLLRLASLWGSQSLEKHATLIAKTLLGVLRNDKESDAARIAAAHQLVQLRATDPQIIEDLLEFVTPRSSPTLATGILEALGFSTSPLLGPSLIKQLPLFTPTARTAALRILLSRPETTRQFLDAMEKGQVQMGDLTLDQKQSLAAHPDTKIAARSKLLLQRAGGLPNPDRQKVVEQLLPLTQRTGDPAQGKLVFKKQCAVCHAHGGEGAKIAPDLTGMAVHPKVELLVNIIDPSRSVEGNFRLYTVTTQDGLVLSGLLASETKTSIELVDLLGKKQVLQRDSLDQIIASNKSFMPEGFEKQLSPDELVNLLEFLTQRGRFLPLPLGKAATIVSTQGMFTSKDAGAERLIFPDWSTKTFKGVPFQLVDPQGERVPNVILLQGPGGQFPPKMPRSVRLPCNSPAKAIHLLSGVSGWGYPFGQKGSVSMIVRLHYAGGQTEDHPLRNGEHFADYMRRIDVPGSEFAFALRSQQIRYLSVFPQKTEAITFVEFVKGEDQSAPVIMAVTVETK
jgi:putative membrane-bound dehydrogenase-like protein